ncbi:MAG: glycosyltransferase [Gammaproteobacteria bacterium]
MIVVAAIALGLWLTLLLVPWQPWRCRERLEATDTPSTRDDFTVLIPARNEADVIADTLNALALAAPQASVIVIDDESSDATASKVRDSVHPHVRLLVGSAPPPDWTGKLWALEQGLRETTTPRVLLLDADIALAPGMIAALERQADNGYELVSVLAAPCFDGMWAHWLLPAFVYFFKLIYPFALVNHARSRLAAAAGGVVLVEREALARAGAFGAWRDELIDDCTLAARLKTTGARCWLGLTHGAHSQRRQGLGSIIVMVARTAYVQLGESPLMLLAASALMLLAFIAPLAALAAPGPARWLGLAAWAALALSYLPTLLYYGLNPLQSVFLPVTAFAYLAMSWHSALRAWFGTRSIWKGRHYTSPP